MTKTGVFFITFLLTTIIYTKPQALPITKDKPSNEFQSNLQSSKTQNLYEVQFTDEEILEGKMFLLIVESQNPNLIVSIMKGDNASKNKLSVILDLTTYSGNIAMVMSDQYFNGKFNFVKEQGILRFLVSSSNEEEKINGDYKIKISISDKLDLNFGLLYTTRIDFGISSLKANVFYDGTNKQNLKKLRFQIVSVRQKVGYALSSSLSYKNDSFQMNNIFKKSVGGILSMPMHPICLEKDCLYELNIKFKNIKILNIETNFIEDVDILSASHYEGFYDRTYLPNTISYYKLPYTKDLNKLDVSISLIPVTEDAALYVNAKTKPLQLDKYNWKETGNLAKRITIRLDELEQMQALESDLYIAVFSGRPGEFIINVDAHETGFKGRLNPGISEGGFVKFDELNSYLYNFEVYENQDINFDVKLNIISGDADLYLKKCEENATCLINKDELSNPNLLKQESTQNSKQIQHSFKCENKKKFNSTVCQFLIVVKGKENHGTHFDLSLQEENFHRLMLPGKSFSINLYQGEKAYLKFSYPNSDVNNTLYFSLEQDYGDFNLYFSRNEEYPTKEKCDYQLPFTSNTAGLLDSSKQIQISQTDLGKFSLQGPYFLTIEAFNTTSARVKFFEKKNEQNSISVHALTAGRQERGEISNSDEIIYYTIKFSLDQEEKKKARINLTSLKGDFIIFANNNGQLPTNNSYQYFSQDNHLELPIINTGKGVEEYIIGIKKTEPIKEEGAKFQFLISFTYDKSALQLKPGILSTFLIYQSNLFFMDIHDDMKNLFIVKTIVDGYNIKLCASFGGTQDVAEKEQCDYEANDKSISIFLLENELKEKCKDFKPCFMHLQITGGLQNEKFQLGFTYNDLPFQLTKGAIFTGPAPIANNQTINFIYHPELSQPCNVYFNSKGQNLEIFTKLINGSNLQDSKLTFPDETNTDLKINDNSFIQNMFYTKNQLGNVSPSPELLITIRTKNKNPSTNLFDPNNPFLLQLSGDSMELLRTHTQNVLLLENEWSYFHFYNNGSADNLRIFINSNINTNLEAYLAKGLQSRPPFTNSYLIQKTGLQNLEIQLNQENLKNISDVQKNELQGHFVLALLSKQQAEISIFWNNKKELNYIELTPGQEHQMTLEIKRPFYFSFVAKEVSTQKVEDRGKIVIYLRTTVKAILYVIKTDQNDMEIPGENNFTWKSFTGQIGGITAITITPKDADYCIDCTYIGAVVSSDSGKLNILADIEHKGFPLELQYNSPFPCFLEAHETKKFRLWNPDQDLVDITVSMMSGYVDVFVSELKDVDEEHFKDRYSLRKNLETHKLIVIAPTIKYQINEAHEFFLYIKNTADYSSSLLLTIDKNNISSPIFPGIKKISRLAPGETTNFHYTPQPSENLFEVQMELKSVFNQEFKTQALSLMQDYLNVYHFSDSGERYLLKYKQKHVFKNRVYITFDITENTSGTFTIHIYNPVGSGVTVAIDLLNGGYRLLNLNEHNFDFIEPEKRKFYEFYGEQGFLLYFDLKMCFGDVKVSFMQSDFTSPDKEKTEQKIIKDNNTFLHHLKMSDKRMFVEVENKKKNPAYYDLLVYLEKKASKNPYSDIVQKNEGKVRFETDSNKINFDALQIKSYYSKNFFHKITYTVYLSANFKTMRFAKNCGEFMLDHNFPDDQIFVFDLSQDISKEQLNQDIGPLSIQLSKLPPAVKFYGVLVATIDVFPQDLGQISPLRTNKVFYDEFIFITPKYDIPFVYVIAVILVSGFVLMLFFIIKSYVFGKINKGNKHQIMTITQDVDEGSLGYLIMKAMENDMIKELKEEEEHTKEKDIEEKVKDEEIIQQMEMTEQKNREVPLERFLLRPINSGFRLEF